MTLNQEPRCENIKFSILCFETMMCACVLIFVIFSLHFIIMDI